MEHTLIPLGRRSLPTPAPAPWPSQAWYAIADARALKPGKVVSLTRFGQRYVLWRGADGGPRLAHARCPHRGADLGQGRIVAGALECPYHGFRFEQDGRCSAMPCEGPEAKIPRAMALDLLPLREVQDRIWLWRGAEPAGGLPPVPECPELPTLYGRGPGRELVWNTSLQRQAESLLDMHHVAFAHRRTAPGVGAFLADHEVTRDGDVIDQSGILKHHGKEGGFPFRSRVWFPLTAHIVLGTSLHIYAAGCPIDRDRMWMHFWYSQDLVKVPGLSWALCWAAEWFEARFVQPEDQAIAETAEPLESRLSDCVLVKADRPIAHWYRLAKERSKREEGERKSA